MRSFLLFLCLAACGGSKPTVVAPSAAGNEAQQMPEGSPLPSNKIRRSVVRAVVQRGLGAFLQNVPVDSPVFLGGKFHGFKLASVPRDWTIDLKAGDVITSVNGFSVEKPDDAYAAFQSLEVASELRVDYERNGEPRALRFAIVED